MTDIRLKVNTDQIKKQAVIVSDEIRETERTWKMIQGKFESSQKYWVGEASKKHQRYIKKAIVEVDHLLKRMKEHPVDLLKMASIYDKAERGARSVSGKLPNSVIK